MSHKGTFLTDIGLQLTGIVYLEGREANEKENRLLLWS